jgi:hypothetical protein
MPIIGRCHTGEGWFLGKHLLDGIVAAKAVKGGDFSRGLSQILVGSLPGFCGDGDH